MAHKPPLTALVIAVLAIVILVLTGRERDGQDSFSAGAGEKISQVDLDTSLALGSESLEVEQEYRGERNNVNVSPVGIFSPASSSDSGRPTTDSSFQQGNFTDEVYAVFHEVFTRLGEGQLDEAKNELDALLTRFEALNGYEQFTLFEFYSNYYLLNGQLPEAIESLENLIAIENVPDEARNKATRTIAQLSAALDDFDKSILYYERFLSESSQRDQSVLLGLATSYYQTKQYSNAIAPLIEHIDTLYNEGAQIDRNKLGLLNVLAIETDDYVSAAWVSEIMVEQYDQMSDWRNLEAIYKQLGQEGERLEVIARARQAGHLDDSDNWIESDQ